MSKRWVGFCVAAVIAVSAGAAACSKDHSSSTPADAAGPSTSATASTSTASSSPAPTTASQQSTDSAVPCNDQFLDMQESPVVNTASGDFDGDGSPDTATLYEQPAHVALAPSTFHVRVDLGKINGAVGANIDDADATSVVKPRILGTSRLADRDVIFVLVGSGASANLVGLFTVQGCDLLRLDKDGQETFAVGGSVTHLDGLRCASGTLQVESATSFDGETYDATNETFALDNGHLASTHPATTASFAINDPALQPYSTIDCPGVQLP